MPTSRTRRQPGKWSKAALIGKAGEALVAAELLRQGTNVAYPAFDGGIDLLANRELNFERVVPLQIKARSSTCHHFQRSWSFIPRLVLVQVWHAATEPQFYIFSDIKQVEQALGSQTCGEPVMGTGRALQCHESWNR